MKTTKMWRQHYLNLIISAGYWEALEIQQYVTLGCFVVVIVFLINFFCRTICIWKSMHVWWQVKQWRQEIVSFTRFPCALEYQHMSICHFGFIFPKGIFPFVKIMSKQNSQLRLISAVMKQNYKVNLEAVQQAPMADLCCKE